MESGKKRSRKKKALAIAGAGMSLRYNYVGNKAKYQAQAGLARRDYRMLKGGAKQVGHDFGKLPRGGQVALGGAFAAATGYAVYKNRDHIKSGYVKAKEKLHHPQTPAKATRFYGQSLIVRGTPNMVSGVRHRNVKAFATGLGQVGTGGIIVSESNRSLRGQERRIKLKGKGRR